MTSEGKSSEWEGSGHGAGGEFWVTFQRSRSDFSAHHDLNVERVVDDIGRKSVFVLLRLLRTTRLI
jgi:hypothetical protein